MDRVAASYMNTPRIVFILFISLFLSFLVFATSSSAADAEDEKQVGAFSVEENAQALRNRLTAEGKYAYLRKKEAGGKTIYAVIVRESGEAPADALDEEQVGVFGVEENAQALRNDLAAEGKNAFLRKKEVDGKTYYAVIVSTSGEASAPPEAEATVEESAKAEAGAMPAASAALGEEPMEAEPEPVDVAAPVSSAEMVAVPHEVPVAPEPEQPMEPAVPAPQPAAPMQAGHEVVAIKGLGISFEIEFPSYARVYEGPSFRSRRLGLREDLGMLDVLGDSPDGWLVVRTVNTGRTRYIPADDAKYYKLDRKGRRKEQLPGRPLVK